MSFTASLLRPDVYSFSIPKAQFPVYLTATVNRGFESGYTLPSEDVTGVIDFTRGAVQIHATLATRIHFEAGCTPDGCIINEDKAGTMTVGIAGDIVLPDADGDRVPDRTDNCRFTANPTQTPVATPMVTAPFGKTLTSCADPSIGTAVAADVCDGGPVALSNNAPGRFAVGRNLVTWTGEDAQHRQGVATQTVTVADRTDPMFTSVPPGVRLNTCGPADSGRRPRRLRRTGSRHAERPVVVPGRYHRRDVDGHRRLRQPGHRGAAGHRGRHRRPAGGVRVAAAP